MGRLAAEREANIAKWTADSMPKPDEAEFNIGDPVSYAPYEQVVWKTVIGYKYSHGVSGELLYVVAEGAHSVKMECTGRCLVQSKYFEPWVDDSDPE